MINRITTVIAALFVGASIAAICVATQGHADLATASPAATPAVAKLSPQQMCNLVYINYPRPHWCDRKGHVHWR